MDSLVTNTNKLHISHRLSDVTRCFYLNQFKTSSLWKKKSWKYFKVIWREKDKRHLIFKIKEKEITQELSTKLDLVISVWKGLKFVGPGLGC